MKKMIRTVSLLLASMMMLTLASCGGDTSYISSFNGKKIPAGVYLFQLVAATQEAYGKVEDSTKDILKQEVDGKKAAVWIEENAQQKMKQYLAVEKQFQELGLTFSTEDEQTAVKQAQTEWDNYGEWYSKNGISQASLTEQYRNLVKKGAVFLAYYDKDGKEAVPEDEIKTYFTENYSKLKYVGVAWDTKKTGSELTDAKNAAKKTAEEYLARAKAGENMDQLIQDYNDSLTENSEKKTVEDDTYAVFMPKEGGASFGENFANTMKSMKIGDIELVEGTGKYYVLAKYDVMSNQKKYEERRISLLQTMKTDTFTEKLNTIASEMNLSLNETALKRYTAKKIK